MPAHEWPKGARRVASSSLAIEIRGRDLTKIVRDLGLGNRGSSYRDLGVGKGGVLEERRIDCIEGRGVRMHRLALELRTGDDVKRGSGMP